MAGTEPHEDYLYYREVHLAPYQHLREFFDIPNRAGIYKVTLFSDSLGPLTFAVFRVSKEDDVETLVRQERSYNINNHEFQATFNNLQDTDDLLVGITNSNPFWIADVSVIVVEVTDP
ncbi:MAG: hypothetical protein Q9M14_06130 [Mariprofundaceae bacterium]|nr:hypothetical protein [Mariprofundaceae bacterium]